MAMRSGLALVGPWKVAYQLIELRIRLQRDKAAERVRAQTQMAEFATLLGELPTAVQPWVLRLRRKCPKWSGRGIVLVAGGPRYGALACNLLASLRECGCLLPVEVFYLGRVELECDEMTALAAHEGVVLRDLLASQPTLLDAPGGGYAAKPLALVASGFAEVLLLDADNTALADPTPLFDSDAYRQSGAIFWSDMYALDQTFQRLYDPFGVRHRPTQFEGYVQVCMQPSRLRAPCPRPCPPWLPR